MYDYVRRQQEAQPNMFSSKTFQWMDHSSSAHNSVREPGWVKVYAKDLPRDPLAYSSSSLFTAPRATASNLSVHRSLFTFRRQRQNSDAATRPPSGISSVFHQRRRGFTAPAGSSYPGFDGVAVTPHGSLHHIIAGSSYRRRRNGGDAAASHKDAADHRPIASQCATEDARSAFTHMPFAGSNSIRPANDNAGFSSSCLFPALGHFTHHHPSQLHSSFSPPLSPRPRTICAKARSLMHRVRYLKPNSKNSSNLQQPVVAVDGGGGHSYSAPIQHAGPPRGRHSRGFSARRPRRPTPPSASEVAGGAAKSRALPRSPLANPMVIAPQKNDQLDSESSDEEMLRCEVCHHYKGADWIVHCNAGHLLCFGCIQGHVAALLADKPSTDVVFCLCAGCQSYVPSRFLRQCLSPQRFKQIVDNCVLGFQTRQLAKRSDSFGAEDGPANPGEEGFDEPIVVAEELPKVVCVASRSAVDDVRGLAQAAGEQVFSASMPALPRPTQSPLPAFVSELTSVERASMSSVVFAASVAADSSLTLSPESVGSRLRRVAKAQENVRVSPGSHTTGAIEESPGSLTQAPGAPIGDYADMDLDAFMCTPQPPQIPLFDSAASPISWSPATPAQPQFQPKQEPSRVPPPLPASLPAHFRASATWITPEQRYSGYTENLLLNATLFETIRRQPSPVDGYESEGNRYSTPVAVAAAVTPRLPVPAMVPDDSGGVYIPTWRRAADDARQQYQMPLWAASEFGSQSGVLCEAAELNFDLYETLHRRR